jgi:DNA-binding CsgD family transcriptional regulator
VATVVTSVTVEFHLSPRETQVLFAAAVGQSTKETAADLGISHKTVEYFWSRIFNKLHCRSQMEVMAILLSDACERLSRRFGRILSGPPMPSITRPRASAIKPPIVHGRARHAPR